MKWIISGSRGFLGSRLALHLINKGEQVRSIPRDLLYNYYDLKKYLESEKPDVIVHLAAWGNHSTQTDLDKIVASNIGCTTTLLQASKNVNFKAFINTSTSSVYLPRQTFYSASKQATENICHAFFQEHNKPIISIRPASITGSGEQETHLIPTLIRSCLYEEEIPFVSEPTHDFIDVRDFVSAIETIVKNISISKGKVFNISNNKSYSNEEVKNIIEKITGRKALINRVASLRSYDHLDWKIDNSELLKLGWKPKYSLEKSIRFMV